MGGGGGWGSGSAILSFMPELFLSHAHQLITRCTMNKNSPFAIGYSVNGKAAGVVLCLIYRPYCFSHGNHFVHAA